MALPLVLLAHLPRVYQAINAQAPQIPQTVAMLQLYVHDTDIDPVGAVFNVQHWNVFGTANRTINIAKGSTQCFV
jgi:hypothetical protein